MLYHTPIVCTLMLPTLYVLLFICLSQVQIAVTIYIEIVRMLHNVDCSLRGILSVYFFCWLIVNVVWIDGVSGTKKKLV